MRPYRIIALTFLAPAALALTLGCGGDKGGGNAGGGDNKVGGAPSKPAAGGKKEALEAKPGELTTLKGRVVYDGDPPVDDGKLKMQMMDHKDSAVCLKGEGETTDFTWRVGPDKGVENVAIWVEPPDGKYFKPNTPNEAVWKKDDVKIDQPHCAFEPHVSLAFVAYPDGKEMKKTGQKIKILNSAPMVHNTKWSGGAFTNTGDNPTIAPKDEYDMTPKVSVDPKAAINLQCNIHTWMRGYLWPLDTPYYALTGKDGRFEIKDLPAGAEVYVVKWHEGKFLDGDAKGVKVPLKPGTTDLGDIKIKK
jgi:hypothetical protein